MTLDLSAIFGVETASTAGNVVADRAIDDPADVQPDDGGLTIDAPQDALTPDLLGRLKAHKGELLTLLQRAPVFDVDSAPDAEPAPESEKRTHRLPPELRRPVEATPDTCPNIDPTTTTEPKCRCGSPTWHDVPIHDGRSVRRECGRCGRFIDFPIWYGKDTGHNGQHGV